MMTAGISRMTERRREQPRAEDAQTCFASDGENMDDPLI
jgi:hypothetical protein